MALDPAAVPPEALVFVGERHLAALTTLRPDGSPHTTAVGFTSVEIFAIGPPPGISKSPRGSPNGSRLGRSALKHVSRAVTASRSGCTVRADASAKER